MPSDINTLEYRIEQLEIALMNLMFVVANQEKELPLFKENIKKAEKVANENKDMITLLVSKDKAEASMSGHNKEIVSLIESRLEKGRREYKQEVDVFDGRDWTKEALEELLDACVYITAEILKIKKRSENE